MEYVTKEDHKEDLKTDRRVTRAEADIVHTNEKVKAVDTDVQNHKVQYRTEFRFIAVLLVSITIGLFYFIHHVNMEMQRQFADMSLQFGDMSLQFGELRSDVADNRRLIEANSTQLVSLRSEVEETNKRIDEVNDRIDGMSDRIDEVNDRLDNVDGRLAVVENVLSIDHQTSAYYKTGKL